MILKTGIQPYLLIDQSNVPLHWLQGDIFMESKERLGLCRTAFVFRLELEKKININS